jgi:hypothetical protein
MLHATSYTLQPTSFKLQATSYELLATNYELQAIPNLGFVYQFQLLRLRSHGAVTFSSVLLTPGASRRSGAGKPKSPTWLQLLFWRLCRGVWVWGVQLGPALPYHSARGQPPIGLKAAQEFATHKANSLDGSQKVIRHE